MFASGERDFWAHPQDRLDAGTRFGRFIWAKPSETVHSRPGPTNHGLTSCAGTFTPADVAVGVTGRGGPA